MEKKKNHSVIATTSAISFLLSLAAIIAVTSFPIPSTSLLPFPLVADGQPERLLPVLLIHGYRSTLNVWDEWEDKLGQAGVYAKAVTFPRNDECGNATDYAIQLNKIVRDFKLFCWIQLWYSHAVIIFNFLHALNNILYFYFY